MGSPGLIQFGAFGPVWTFPAGEGRVSVGSVGAAGGDLTPAG